MFKKLIKSVLFPLSILPLIGSCSLFPKTKVIEYDEEVKLSDGSMIWVHIKRHYIQTGGREIPNLFQGYEKGWGAKEVEISWDTGFPNVGRKSVFFDDYVAIINKYNGNWYVAGEKNSSSDRLIKSSTNCNSVGILIASRCIVAINQKGEYFKPHKDDIYHIINRNLIYPIQIRNWGNIPDPLHNSKLTWNEKVNLDKLQSSRFNGLQKPFFIGENK